MFASFGFASERISRLISFYVFASYSLRRLVIDYDMFLIALSLFLSFSDF